jgi:hypothetical protein
MTKANRVVASAAVQLPGYQAGGLAERTGQWAKLELRKEG